MCSHWLILGRYSPVMPLGDYGLVNLGFAPDHGCESPLDKTITKQIQTDLPPKIVLGLMLLQVLLTLQTWPVS